MSALDHNAPVQQVAPHSPDAEARVVGLMLQDTEKLADAVGTQLEADHFYIPAFRVLYDELVNAYYAEEPTDPLSIAERVRKPLAGALRCEERDVAGRVAKLAASQSGSARDAAVIIRRHADSRALLALAFQVISDVQEGKQDPEELAGAAAHNAMRIATSTVQRHELVTFTELGPRIVRRQQQMASARERGIELGAYFGMKFMDSFVRGMRPGELLFIAGEPGAGKSAVAWKAVQQFAERQLKKPKDRRIGALVLSLEMAEEPSTDRVAQGVAMLDGGALREGRLEQADLQKIVDRWAARRDLPLLYNFSPGMSSHQLRAITTEAIQRHNVGVVVIDHLRYLHHPAPPGQRWSVMEAEEDLVRFLKQDYARQLDIAVIVLAHTVKAISEDGRPRMRDLRGGQMVSAHADHIAFVHRPYRYASERDIEDGTVKRTDAEMIWEKNRHGLTGAAEFYFDPATMNIL